MCEHEGCGVILTPRKSPGRNPRFCPEHQGGKFAQARSRANRKNEQPRPQCCIDAGRAGGRTSCPQHKDSGLGIVGAGSPYADYAGAFPRSVRRNAPELPPPGTWHVDDGRDVYGQWETETYQFDHALRGTRIGVIGQGPDMTADEWLASVGETWTPRPSPEPLERAA